MDGSKTAFRFVIEHPWETNALLIGGYDAWLDDHCADLDTADPSGCLDTGTYADCHRDNGKCVSTGCCTLGATKCGLAEGCVHINGECRNKRASGYQGSRMLNLRDVCDTGAGPF